MDQITNDSSLSLDTLRIERKKSSTIFFDKGNRAGIQIHLDEDTGTMWWSSYSTGTEKYRIHSYNRPAIEWSDGTQAWIRKGLYHRMDGPAIEYNDLEGKEGKYYLNGVEISKDQHKKAALYSIEPVVDMEKTSWVMESTSIPHRVLEPAVVWDNGMKEWFWRGNLHNSEGPARLWPDGSYAYYNHGALHRENQPATEGVDGSQGWFYNGVLHRPPQDGPAVTHDDGGLEFWKDGARDNRYGPAVIYPEGDVEYWLGGKKYSFEKWEEVTSKDREGLLKKTKESFRSAIRHYLKQSPGDAPKDFERLVEESVETMLKGLTSKEVPEPPLGQDGVVEDEAIIAEWGLDLGEMGTVEDEASIAEWGIDPAHLYKNGDPRLDLPPFSKETDEFINQLELDFAPVKAPSEPVQEEGVSWAATGSALLIAAGIQAFTRSAATEQTEALPELMLETEQC